MRRGLPDRRDHLRRRGLDRLRPDDGLGEEEPADRRSERMNTGVKNHVLDTKNSEGRSL